MYNIQLSHFKALHFALQSHIHCFQFFFFKSFCEQKSDLRDQPAPFASLVHFTAFLIFRIKFHRSKRRFLNRHYSLCTHLFVHMLQKTQSTSCCDLSVDVSSQDVSSVLRKYAFKISLANIVSCQLHSNATVLKNRNFAKTVNPPEFSMNTTLLTM